MMNWIRIFGTALCIAVSLCSSEALACPGCTLTYVYRAYPELGLYNHILGIWMTLLVVGWSLSELNHPYPKLRGIVTGALLSTCTADLLFLSYGLLLGIPLLVLSIAAARRRVPEVRHKYFFECVSLGWLVGIAATMINYSGFAHPQGTNIIMFLLGFVLTLILFIAYCKLTNERKFNYWRVVIIVCVLLGPWLCVPVTVLNGAAFFGGFPRDNWFQVGAAIDRHALSVFLRSIHLVVWLPLIVSVGALIFRNYIEMNKLTRLVIAVGLCATPIAIAVSQ